MGELRHVGRNAATTHFLLSSQFSILNKKKFKSLSSRNYIFYIGLEFYIEGFNFKHKK